MEIEFTTYFSRTVKVVASHGAAYLSIIADNDGSRTEAVLTKDEIDNLIDALEKARTELEG